MKGDKLNPKQQRFVQEYLIDFNATQAAIRAGYSEKSAKLIGHQLLNNTKLSKAIAEAKNKTANKLEITKERWLKEIFCYAFLDPLDLFEEDGSLKLLKNIPESARRAIAGLEVTEIFDNAKDDQKMAIGLLKKIKLISKHDGLEMVGKALGFLEDKIKGDFNLNLRFDYDVENGNGKD